MSKPEDSGITLSRQMVAAILTVLLSLGGSAGVTGLASNHEGCVKTHHLDLALAKHAAEPHPGVVPLVNQAKAEAVQQAERAARSADKEMLREIKEMLARESKQTRELIESLRPTPKRR